MMTGTTTADFARMYADQRPVPNAFVREAVELLSNGQQDAALSAYRALGAGDRIVLARNFPAAAAVFTGA